MMLYDLFLKDNTCCGGPLLPVAENVTASMLGKEKAKGITQLFDLGHGPKKVKAFYHWFTSGGRQGEQTYKWVCVEKALVDC